MKSENQKKTRTKIVNESLENAPVTSFNTVTYHYDFNEKRYRFKNPHNFKPPKEFPFSKIELVITQFLSISGLQRYKIKHQKIPKSKI